MIVLTVPANLLVVQVTTALTPGQELPCYCSWINSGSPNPFGAQYTALPGSGAITQIATMTATLAMQISEITISNSTPSPTPPVANPLPVNIDIYIFDGPNYYKLYQCTLQAAETLTYNPTLGANGTWTIFSSRGQAVS
jgi:hypothetical protein